MDRGEATPFGRALRAHRVAAGLSQEALAERAGISADAVAALERGRRRRPRAHTLGAIADALGLDVGGRDELRATVIGGSPTGTPLPDAVSPLIGRDADLDDVVGLLTARASLVTLTGPGGVGKTRLALAVAHRLADTGSRPVRWIRLGAVTDAAGLSATVSAALGARQVVGSNLVEAVLSTLDEGTLLVLDNCEQVLEAVGRLCSGLVSHVGDVRVLATSRELLRVPGEVVRPLAPLALPDPAEGWSITPESLPDWPATRLFLDRAADAAGSLALGGADAAAVAQVCQRLDGLPLAIELAAARLGALTPLRLLAELDASLRVVSGGPATEAERYQTLDGAIGWSFDLLGDVERAVLLRLSVASGGWTLEAAQGFAGGDGVPAADILEVVTSLVRKSLVVLSSRTGQGRYALLRVIRLYAAERLESSGEANEVRHRHAVYYSGLAERAGAELRAPDQRSWLGLLDADVDNLRTALRYWCDAGDTGAALRMVTAVWRYWYLRGLYGEGRKALAAVLRLAEASPDTDPDLHARALVAEGTLAYMQCEYEGARARISSGLALHEHTGRDVGGMADALQRLGSVAREQGGYDHATALHQESLALWRRAGDRAGVGEALNYLSLLAWLTGHPARAGHLADEALACFRGEHPGEGTVWAMLNLGVSARYSGHLDEADRRLHESLARSDDLGYAEGTAWSLEQLGALAWAHADRLRAWDLWHESLALHVRLGDRWRAATVLEGMAASAAGGSDTERRTAARLVGVAASLRTAIGTPRPPCEQPAFDRTAAALRADLGTSRYDGLTAPGWPLQVLGTLAAAMSVADVEAALAPGLRRLSPHA
ncbi:MAG: ATP-binding protein [Marmoricola sp.]